MDQFVGCVILTGQEAPETNRRMREDLYKKTMMEKTEKIRYSDGFTGTNQKIDIVKDRDQMMGDA